MLVTEPATQMQAAEEAVALAAPQPEEFGDADFVHVIGYGALFGIPTICVVGFLILLPLGVASAFGVSLFVAFWAGPFAGAVVMLARRNSQLEHEMAAGDHPG